MSTGISFVEAATKLTCGRSQACRITHGTGGLSPPASLELGVRPLDGKKTEKINLKTHGKCDKSFKLTSTGRVTITRKPFPSKPLYITNTRDCPPRQVINLEASRGQRFAALTASGLDCEGEGIVM